MEARIIQHEKKQIVIDGTTCPTLYAWQWEVLTSKINEMQKELKIPVNITGFHVIYDFAQPKDNTIDALDLANKGEGV